MSCYYKIEVEVSPCEKSGIGEVRAALEAWGMDVDGAWDTPIDGTVAFWGHMTLSGSPSDAHDELRARLPKGTKLVTRWLNLDAHDWDYTFGENEDESENESEATP